MLTGLEREMMVAAGRLSMTSVRQIVRLGAQRQLVARLSGAGLLGVARVSIGPSGWEPEGPENRLLLGVVDSGELIDVVALSSGHRDEWSLRTGLGWALGADAVADAHRAIASAFNDKSGRIRLRLHATPFDWLAAGGDGVCVLDWNAASLLELRGLGERVTLEVPPGGAEKIRGLLAYGALPRVAETRAEYAGDIAA